MLYSDFRGMKLSRLGFGAMRLPLNADKTIDTEQVEKMVEHAMANGVNYFDTAYPYHGGLSEIVLGAALAKYPRESWHLATKYPGHQIASSYDPAGVFEEQLKKCGVDYFDFYLLHNVYENSVKTYTDPKWGIMDYFIEQRRLGRIKHLGFSCHATLESLKDFIDKYADEMEFCQIQLNYLDWTLQNGKEKYELLTERGIPVWVMEPVRGGKLACLRAEDEAKLRALRPNESATSWCLRFLAGLPNVKVILSGMSTLAQMVDNVNTFCKSAPQTARERELLLSIAEGMKSSVPCTACRYCCDGCPAELDIPALIAAYNELRVAPNINVGMRIEALPPQKRPDACLACGACAEICPQKINVPAELVKFAELLKTIPSWAEICRERDEAAARLRSAKQ